MTDLAPPITRPLDWGDGVAKSRAAAHELLPLLKVRMVHALLVTLLIVAQYWFQLAASLSDQPRLLVETFFGLYQRNVMYWIIGVAVITVLQTRISPGHTRTIMLFSSVLVWSALWFLWLHWGPLPTFFVVELGLTTEAGAAMDGAWTTTIYLLLAAWYYESADRVRRSKAALRQSELVRRGAERWLLELRLGSLQGRLDPQVLFDTMDEAVRLYRSRPAAAEQLLDALIQYLRRALPRLRQSQSTLEQEVALAFAFAGVLRTRNSEPLELEVAVEPAAGDACFPPMVVQPLCESLARVALTTGERARICIFAAREQDRARLYLSAQPVQSAPSLECLANIRHTLLTMFGPVARVDATDPTMGVLHVVVEVPYDAAPRTGS